MAIPAAPPPGIHGWQPPPRRSRPSRRGARWAGGALSVVAGLAVLGFGFVQIGGAVAPHESGPAPASQSLGVASGRTSGSPSASPSSGPAASATSTPRPSDGSGPGSQPPPSDPSAAALSARLQTTLDRLRLKLGIPGVSATILMPDGTAWTGVSGLADVAGKAKVTPETAFAYASASKTFTSALILQLIGEGRLRLGDSAARLLPRLRLKVDPRITVAMLLDHTSGLADYFLNPKIDGPLQKLPSATWSIDRTLGYVGKRRSPPGQAWHYSNTNYLLLGLIAERLTGESLATAIRTRLLDPTGLDSTWYQAAEPGRAPLAHGYRLSGTGSKIRPIDLDDGTGIAPFRSVVTAAAGAGSIAGTSADLARWARALYTSRVLGPVTTGVLLSDFRKTTNYVPGVVYGFGVQALSVAGHPSLGHSGRFLGFRSVVRHFPIDGLTIAVLTNQSRADPAVILRALLLQALPTAPACPACPIPH
jgi:D-alanyl-D-alanine carboxypeptidase